MTIGFLVIMILFSSVGVAADWPTWRADPQRTAQVSQELPEKLSVQWVRQLPPLKAAYSHHRLQFDGGYEPIIAEGRLFLASSLSDSMTAYDASTGKLIWRFYSNGPVRFAPVFHQGRIFFGSDDGYLYCLKASDGKLIWRFRAVPSARTVLGNRRVISVWPIRGGPVLSNGTLYFSAGVWPFEGVFVYALDPKTGAVKWLNDHTGHIYGVQPHNARSIGGLTPQGYLVVNGDELIVPCSAGSPAIFNRHTGKLIHFEPPSSGRKPGGWFAMALLDPKKAKAIRRGELTFDSLITSDRHEDRKMRGDGLKGIRSQINAGNQLIKFSKVLPGVDGKVNAMAIAQDTLFVSTLGGRVYALANKESKAITYKQSRMRLKAVTPETETKAKFILKQTKIKHGHALVLGAGDGSLIEALISQSPMHFLVIEPDPKVANKLRKRWDDAGIYGSRVVIHCGNSNEFKVPNYFANLIVCEDLKITGLGSKGDSLSKLLNGLRPFGGTALIDGDAKMTVPKGASKRMTKQWTIVNRHGPLPGSSNYTGDWQSKDDLVRAPLGVLWYDDATSHFKRSPQPLFIDGVMISQTKDWSNRDIRPYPLQKATYTDVYTGRRINANEALIQTEKYNFHDSKKKQPTVYRPPELTTKGLNGKLVNPGQMINPLNGHKQKRVFPKSYGCDGGVDYGKIISMRSGTAAYYDKVLESGTIHISGPRSGCTNSIIPANGLLNLPYFYEGCTCSYPLPVALALIKLPQIHEQWASFGKMEVNNIARLGLNFGAPGDRMTNAGTLWLDSPGIGGPSPNVKVSTEPASAKAYYNHALWIRGGRGWPWVAASGISGIRTLKIAGLRSSTFTVRLTFAETELKQAAKRQFDVTIQDKKILNDFDPILKAGGPFRAYVHEVKNIKVGKDGIMIIRFEAKIGQAILSGIELGTAEMPLSSVPILSERKTTRLLTR